MPGLQRQTSAYQKHWKRQAAAAVAVAKADLLPQTLQQRRSPLGRPLGLQHVAANGSGGGGGVNPKVINPKAYDASQDDEDLESPRVPSQLVRRQGCPAYMEICGPSSLNLVLAQSAACCDRPDSGCGGLCCLERPAAACYSCSFRPVTTIHSRLQGQRSTSAPLPPQNGGQSVGTGGSSDGSGGSASDGNGGGGGQGPGSSRGGRPRRHPRPYARIKFVLRPARDDPHYAEWCIFLWFYWSKCSSIVHRPCFPDVSPAPRALLMAGSCHGDRPAMSTKMSSLLQQNDGLLLAAGAHILAARSHSPGMTLTAGWRRPWTGGQAGCCCLPT